MAPPEPKWYVFDLGIDTDLAIEGTVYPLQIPLSQVKDSGSTIGQPAWCTKFSKNDRLAFRLWSVDERFSLPSCPVHFRAIFRSPATGELSSPLEGVPNPIDYGRSEIVECPVPPTPSVYPHAGARWQLGSGPFFTLNPSAGETVFLLQFAVDVVVGSQLRRYRSDPEVVVGESSDPNHVGEEDPPKPWFKRWW